jgi:hypothetical protein
VIAQAFAWWAGERHPVQVPAKVEGDTIHVIIGPGWDQAPVTVDVELIREEDHDEACALRANAMHDCTCEEEVSE